MQDISFRTEISPVSYPFSISHSDNIMLAGSCFVENIGGLMKEAKFNVDINPYGILYNPLSISKSIKEIISCKVYSEKDIFCYNDLWHSFMHHGSFSCQDKNECLERINRSIKHASEFLRSADYLFLTFGTAYIYRYENEVVSNCHKLQEKMFCRKLASVSEMTEEMSDMIVRLKEYNSKLKIVCTVSPIRHIRDGLHQNQISKASLLLMINELAERYNDTLYYFPAYEIVMDDLRDYRFYAEDMVHVSGSAIQYIWNIFSDSVFSKGTKETIGECRKIAASLNHRPLHPDSEEYRKFVSGIRNRIDNLVRKYDTLDFSSEYERIENILSGLNSNQ